MKYFKKISLISLALYLVSYDAIANDFDYTDDEFSSWEIEITGSMKAGLQYSSQNGDLYSWDDNNNNDIIDAGEPTNLDHNKFLLKTDSIINFEADYYFNTGMSVTAFISLEVNEPNVKVTEQYLHINLGLAYIELGVNDSIIKQLQASGSDPSAGFVDLDGKAVLDIDKNTIITSNDLNNVAGRAVANANLADETHIFKYVDDLLVDSGSISPTSDALKVSLISDIYSGFSFGVSYTPSYDESSMGYGTGTNTSSDNDPNIWLDNYEFAGQFSREFMGMELSMSSAYYIASSGADQLTNVNHNKSAYSLGFEVVSNGFEFGGSYGITNVKYDDSIINSNDYYLDSRIIELAANYQFGEITLGTGFFRSETSKKDYNKNKIADGVYSHITAGLGYNMAEGLIFGLEAVAEFYDETDYNNVIDNNDDDLNEASAYLVGSYIATLF